MAKRPKKSKRVTGRRTGKTSIATGAGGGEESTGATGEAIGATGEASGETIERVGVLSVSGQNKVEVNESELRAELDTILAEQPPPVATGEVVSTDEGATDAQPVGDSWVVLCQGVVPVLAITVLPQWNITADEKNELAQSLGLCLDQIAPGGLSGKYACWARLVFCMGGIAVSRAMANGGKLPAFGPRKQIEKKQNDSEAPNPSAAN